MKKEIFQHPELCTELAESESPLWFWNDKLEKEELLRQLNMMSEIGVTCNIPHGRVGYIGGYLNEEWMEHIRTVLEYKKNHNEPVWLYDEFAWPAGTCNREVTKNELFREQYLTFRKMHVPAGEAFRWRIKPVDGCSMADDLRKLPPNVFVFDEETMEQIDITPMIQKDVVNVMTVYSFTMKRDRSSIVYTVQTNQAPYGKGGATSAAYINKEATKHFIELTYDKYYDCFSEYFGDTIKAIFDDETRMRHAFVWSSTFAQEFIKRKGYDIRYHLADLIIPGVEAGRTRCDYFDVLAALFQENYLGEIADWCHNHGISLYAHLLGEETLAGHVRFSADMMRQFKNMDYPGVDHLGKGIGSLNVKFGVSAAHNYGKDNFGCEVFAGCGWDMTFEEYVRMISWLYLNGVQIIINHGFFYSIRENRGNDWPPSQFFQWKHYDRMKEGNAMIRRLYYAFTGGRHETEVLIYHPIESYWLHYLGSEDFETAYVNGPFIQDEQAAYIDRELQLLLTGLLEENIDFDVYHDDACENFTVAAGEFLNKQNEERYKVCVLPMCEVLPLRFAEKLWQFAQEGGTVIALHCLPQYAASKSDDAKLRELIADMNTKGQIHLLRDAAQIDELAELIQKAAPCPVKIISGTAKNKNNHKTYPAHLIDPYFHEGEDLDGVAFSRYLKDGKRETYFVNFGQKEEIITVQTRYTETPEVWDSMTGEIYQPEILEQTSENTTVRFSLPVGYGVFLVTER